METGLVSLPFYALEPLARGPVLHGGDSSSIRSSTYFIVLFYVFFVLPIARETHRYNSKPFPTQRHRLSLVTSARKGYNEKTINTYSDKASATVACNLSPRALLFNGKGREMRSRYSVQLSGVGHGLVLSVYIALFLCCPSYSVANSLDIALKQRSTVVTIYKGGKDSANIMGSGFIVDEKGIVATNYHVIAGLPGTTSKAVLVKTNKGMFHSVEKIIGVSDENNIALLKLEGTVFPAVRLSKHGRPRQGDGVLVIGGPLGLDSAVSEGAITGVRPTDDFIETTVSISRSNSGSPVFNMDGEVIGVATFRRGKEQNPMYIIPVKYVADLMKIYLKTDQKVSSMAEEAGGDLRARALMSQPDKKERQPEKPSSPIDYAEWIVMGDRLKAGGKYEEAILSYTRAIEIDPENALGYNNRGDVYVLTGNVRNALEDFSRAISLKPGFVMAYFSRGSLYDKMGMVEFAQEDLSRTIELEPRMALAYNIRCDIHNRLGNYKTAIDDCGKAIHLDPTMATAYAGRCHGYMNTGDYQAALVDCDGAIRIDPGHAEAHSAIGYMYFRAGDCDLGVRNSTRAIELNPRLAAAYVTRCICYGAFDKFQLSLDDCTKAIELEPRNAGAFTGRCIAHCRMGRHEQALDDCTKAIDLDPKESQAYGTRCLIYNVLEKPKQALDDCSKAIVMDPKNSPAYYHHRAMSRRKLGNRQQAIEDLKMGARLGSQEAREALDTLGIQWQEKGNKE